MCAENKIVKLVYWIDYEITKNYSQRMALYMLWHPTKFDWVSKCDIFTKIEHFFDADLWMNRNERWLIQKRCAIRQRKSISGRVHLI